MKVKVNGVATVTLLRSNRSQLYCEHRSASYEAVCRTPDRPPPGVGSVELSRRWMGKRNWCRFQIVGSISGSGKSIPEAQPLDFCQSLQVQCCQCKRCLIRLIYCGQKYFATIVLAVYKSSRDPALGCLSSCTSAIQGLLLPLQNILKKTPILFFHYWSQLERARLDGVGTIRIDARMPTSTAYHIYFEQ